jgi:hypothetical protein
MSVEEVEYFLERLKQKQTTPGRERVEMSKSEPELKEREGLNASI